MDLNEVMLSQTESRLTVTSQLPRQCVNPGSRGALTAVGHSHLPFTFNSLGRLIDKVSVPNALLRGESNRLNGQSRGVEVLVQPEAHELTRHMQEIRKHCATASLPWQLNAVYNALLYQPNKLCIRAVQKDSRPTKTAEQALRSPHSNTHL